MIREIIQGLISSKNPCSFRGLCAHDEPTEEACKLSSWRTEACSGYVL